MFKKISQQKKEKSYPKIKLRVNKEQMKISKIQLAPERMDYFTKLLTKTKLRIFFRIKRNSKT